MKDIMPILKKKLKYIKWWRVLIVGLPPLFLSWPLISGFPYPLKAYLHPEAAEPISVSDTPTKITIRVNGVSDSLGSKPLFALPLKTDISSMLAELCLNNKNEIFDGENRIDPQSLIDAEEAGAMNIRYQNLVSATSDEIYAKLGQKKCKDLPIEGAVILNSEVRNPLPLKAKASVQGDQLKVTFEPKNYSISIAKSSGYAYIKWQWSTFIRNLIISILAWWIFLSIWFSIWNYIYPKQRKIRTKKEIT